MAQPIKTITSLIPADGWYSQYECEERPSISRYRYEKVLAFVLMNDNITIRGVMFNDVSGVVKFCCEDPEFMGFVYMGTETRHSFYSPGISHI